MKAYWAALLTITLVACGDAPRQALGTLERERITLPAPVSERIAEISVREGAVLAAGDTVLLLESSRSDARLSAALAEVSRLESALDEARAGPRPEAIAEARSRLDGAQALARNARHELERTEAVVARRLLPQAELDRAHANHAGAQANAGAAAQQLAALQRGTRVEQIAQAESALLAAKATATSLAIDQQRTRLTAPRAGIVDSLPFEVGDQLPVGTPLAILLVGDRPFARVYLPANLRATLQVGSQATVQVHGLDTIFAGTIRSIRSEPSFTPYYALAGEDASRLSWLAEIELGEDAAQLPVGLPVRAEFAGAAAP